MMEEQLAELQEQVADLQEGLRGSYERQRELERELERLNQQNKDLTDLLADAREFFRRRP